VDCVRADFSHGSHEDHSPIFKTIRFQFPSRSVRPIAIGRIIAGVETPCGEMGRRARDIRYGEHLSLWFCQMKRLKAAIVHTPTHELGENLAPSPAWVFNNLTMAATAPRHMISETERAWIVPGLLKSRKGIQCRQTAGLPMSAMTDKT